MGGNHWHCGYFGSQKDKFNLVWDFSNWAFPIHFSWDSLRFSVGCLIFTLIYWKKKCRDLVSGESELEKEVLDDSEPVHTWFELSYAQFLTIPRIIMQSMPLGWQRDVVRLLREMDNTFDWRPKEGRWWVSLRGDNGKYGKLDYNICNYRHGNVDHLRRNDTDLDDVYRGGV